MKNTEKDYIVPNYVIHAVIAGVCFLLAAAILGILMFADVSPKKLLESSSKVAESSPEIDTRPIVLLDAGHGGNDPGALSGFSDDIEAEIAQLVINLLEDLLKKQENALIILQTRKAGEAATTEQRANTAQQLGASLLISFHLNANEDSSARGFQVFPVPPGRENHEESLHFAQILIKHIKAKTKVPIMGQNGIFYAYYHETKNGDYWQQQIDSAWIDEDELSSSASFGVIENCGCPAVLVEGWFISNKKDMALMNNEAGQKAMAESIYFAICSYFGLDS